MNEGSGNYTATGGPFLCRFNRQAWPTVKRRPGWVAFRRMLTGK